MSRKIYKSAAVLGVTTLLLTGCGSKNPAPDMEMRQTRINNFQKTVDKLQQEEPISGALTLSEAIARAVKYNLDNRVKQMEIAVAQQHLNLARVGYLPEITALAGYSSRNNDPGAISRSLATGEVSLEYSSSQEKKHTLSSLRTSWDVVDFGLTYFTVQQESSKIAIAKEQHRKVIQNIIQDVQEAYWRTYISQQLSSRIEDIVRESDETIARFKELTANGRLDPKEALSQQREILQIRYNVRALQEELAQGPIHLAALLNLRPGTDLKLDTTEKQPISDFSSNIAMLENLALRNRPELRMEDSKKKINTANIRKALLEMFPSIEVWGQVNHDTNDYLYNNSWNEVGLQMSWQLMNTAHSGASLMSYQAEDDLAEARHTALSMAIISQVHLALNRYTIAVAKYNDALNMQEINEKLAELINRDTLRQGQAGFSRIRANLQTTATDMESMLAYAEVRNALMRLYNTLGLDPLDSLEQELSIDEIRQQVEQNQTKTLDSMMD